MLLTRITSPLLEYNPTYATDRVLLPSYSVFDLFFFGIYYKPDELIADRIQLTLKANNLFDKTYWLGEALTPQG